MDTNCPLTREFVSGQVLSAQGWPRHRCLPRARMSPVEGEKPGRGAQVGRGAAADGQGDTCCHFPKWQQISLRHQELATSFT